MKLVTAKGVIFDYYRTLVFFDKKPVGRITRKQPVFDQNIFVIGVKPKPAGLVRDSGIVGKGGVMDARYFSAVGVKAHKPGRVAAPVIVGRFITREEKVAHLPHLNSIFPTMLGLTV